MIYQNWLGISQPQLDDLSQLGTPRNMGNFYIWHNTMDIQHRYLIGLNLRILLLISPFKVLTNSKMIIKKISM